jgi:hypothetical protein
MGPRSEYSPSFEFSVEYCNRHLFGYECVDRKQHGNVNFYYLVKDNKFGYFCNVVSEGELLYMLGDRWYIYMEDNQGTTNKKPPTMSRIT